MKLTKKAVLAANDDIQGKIGFKPELDTKLKGEELYKELYKKSIEVEIDEDDREDLEDSTCEVLDALAEKYSDTTEGGEATETEVEETEEVEEVEEEPEVKEEKPKKEKKSKKKSKGKVDPAELAEEIKTNKKINRDGLYDIVNENSDLFGDAAETLLTITNPMVLKKQMRNVLEGGEVEMTKTKAPAKKEKAPKAEKKEKKEKAPKVVEKSLTEKVNEFDDLDELKAFAKENKKSFPGVKAKKFNKLKKLRKALLEVVEEAPKKNKRKGKTAGKDLEEIRALRQKHIDWITDFIDDAGGKVGRKKLTAKALEAFPKDAKRIRDLISYAKNPKYNKFEKLMAEVDGYIGWEDAFDAPKKSKKAKKEKAPVEEKPKKEKKSKKDKKKKKKNKKK